MAITASVQPKSSQIVYAGSDFPHPIRFCFSQTVWFILCKTSLDPIWFWLTVLGFGQTDLVQNKLVCKNQTVQRFQASQDLI